MDYNSSVMKITFGPVPSRRLGRSLGINNIPPKICSYACVYCQLGNTIQMQTTRREFYPVQDIVKAVGDRVAQLQDQVENVDYLAFVPDGEPTLDINLGKSIEALKPLNIPIAVITNASLIYDPAVQNDLLKADWVSLKIDAVDEKLWRAIDRPYGKLELKTILAGILKFKDEFNGQLVTETMLIKGMNDSEKAAEELGRFLVLLQPDKAYLSIPTRPPAEKNIHPADPEKLNMIYQIISKNGVRAELLTGYEGNEFSFTGNFRQDILNITAVHPMRRDAVNELLERSKADWGLVEEMLTNGEIIQSEYGGHHYYIRRF